MRIALPPAVELALGPVLAGIAARVADEAVRERLDEHGTVARARVRDRVRAASRTVQTLMPSIVSAVTPMTSARARISPAVTGLERRVLAVAVVLADETTGSSKTCAKLRHSKT